MKWMTLAGFVALVSTSVFAAESVERSVVTSAKPSVSIEVDSGRLMIRSWSKSEVKLEGRLDDDVDELDFKAVGDDAVDIVVEEARRRSTWGGDWDGDSDTDLTLLVPVGATLSVEGVNTSVEVSEVSGDVEVDTVNGAITAEALAGEVRLSSVNGAIDVAGTNRDLNIQTVNGGITVREANGKRLTLGVVNGDLEVASSATHVTVEAVSGDVELALGAVDHFEVDAVSGDVKSTLHLQKNGRLNANTVSGDVKLNLIEPVNIRVEAESMSGDLDNRISKVDQLKGKYGVGRTLAFSVGDGSARVQVDTVSGDLTLQVAEDR